MDEFGGRGLRLGRAHLLVDVVGDGLGFLRRIKRRLGALLPSAKHVLDSLLDVVPTSEAFAKEAAPGLRHMAKGRQRTDAGPEQSRVLVILLSGEQVRQRGHRQSTRALAYTASEERRRDVGH